jgi:predicted CopG family antitoxin
MTRKITVTYELPDEVCTVLERQAAQEGRSFEDVVAEYVARHRTRKLPMTAEEEARHRADLERHFGTWDSGDEHFADNDRIDEDLAREYDSRHEG